MSSRLAFTLIGLALVAACSSETSVFDLGVGDCFNDQADLSQLEVTTVDTVDCSEPHDNEIYYEYSMSDAVFPGVNAAFESAFSRCIDEFEAYVGTPYLDSTLDVFPITPTASSWAEGDRVVYCALYAMDLSRLRGSMRGRGI